MVHDHTMSPLTLRRVPPNLLVSQGATDFAVEMGMPILPHDALISPAAKERWMRWRSDLRAAERKSKKSGAHPSCWKIRDTTAPADERAQERMREQHTQNLLRAYPSLLQSHSPPLSDDSMYGQGENASSDPSVPPSEQSSSSWVSDEPTNAPDLTDDYWMYGDSREALREVQAQGQGHRDLERILTLNPACRQQRAVPRRRLNVTRSIPAYRKPQTKM